MKKKLFSSSSKNYGKIKTELIYKMSDEKYPQDVCKVYTHNHKTHPQEKPVALIEYLIKTYSNEGEVVLDATIGSGTTAVAAMKTGRKFIGFELDEHNFEVAERRIEAARLEMNQPRLFEGEITDENN